MSQTDEDVVAAESRPASPSLDGVFDPITADQWRTLANRSLGDSTSVDSLTRETLDGLMVSPLYYDRPSPATPSVIAYADPTQWDNRLPILGTDTASCRTHLTRGLDGGVHSLSLDLTALTDRDTHSLPELLETILDGVHLDLAPIHLKPGDAFDAAGTALTALFERRGHDPAQLRGGFGVDPFSIAVQQGASEAEYRQVLSSMAGFVRSHCDRFPGLQYACIDLVTHHDAGATPVQELVAGIAIAADCLDALLDAGVTLEQSLKALSFHVACDADLTGNVVKLRALKQLWAHTVRQLPEARARFEGNNAGIPIHIDARTSHRMLSSLDPWVNHLRNVTATSAAAIAGTDSISVHPHDLIDGERVSADAELVDRVARNLPIILAEESLLTSVMDPVCGSYAFEHLTGSLAEQAWQKLGELQRQGGLMASIRDGQWKAELDRSHAHRVQRLIDSTDLKIGVNHQRPSDAPSIDLTTLTAAPVSDGANDGTWLPRRREATLFEGHAIGAGDRT